MPFVQVSGSPVTFVHRMQAQFPIQLLNDSDSVANDRSALPGKRPAVNEKCPPAYKSIMQRCWQAEPARRPTFQYIERYLKDELARVRRQRYPNGRVSESSYASAGIRSMSFSGMRMSNVEEEPPELAARSAVARYKDGLFSTDGKERLSLSADNKNMVINAGMSNSLCGRVLTGIRIIFFYCTATYWEAMILFHVLISTSRPCAQRADRPRGPGAAGRLRPFHQFAGGDSLH